jgi:hypothetical protein
MLATSSWAITRQADSCATAGEAAIGKFTAAATKRRAS